MGLSKNKNFVTGLIKEGFCVSSGLVNFEGIQKDIAKLTEGNYNSIWPVADVYTLEYYLHLWKTKKFSDAFKNF